MGILLAEKMTIGETLKEAMFPEEVKFFGMSMDPTLVTAIIITVMLLILALLIRIFVISKFKAVPGKIQLFLESLVNGFNNIALDTASEEAGIVGPYIFTAAVYICIGTLAELVGLRPLMSSINTCVAVSFSTYIMILILGIKHKGVFGGIGNLMKNITLPVSMSFRLFGSILSGFLIMELVYYFIWLSFIVPAALSVMFTLFHAFIQSYIFAMLTAMFTGEALEISEKKEKKKEINKEKKEERLDQQANQ
jgi:F-type H+-transporting ATPase subunit a